MQVIVVHQSLDYVLDALLYYPPLGCYLLDVLVRGSLSAPVCSAGTRGSLCPKPTLSWKTSRLSWKISSTLTFFSSTESPFFLLCTITRSLKRGPDQARHKALQGSMGLHTMWRPRSEARTLLRNGVGDCCQGGRFELWRKHARHGKGTFVHSKPSCSAQVAFRPLGTPQA